MKNIILTTLNARYSHTSLGLRYLLANLKELKEQTEILEFVINSSIQTIAEQILEKNPKIIGIAVYIWNAFDVGELVKTIKKVSPETIETFANYVKDNVKTDSNIRGSAQYRKHLAYVLVKRALVSIGGNA